MSYLQQIPVSDARDYLKLDGNDNDSILEMLIYSACVHFEKQTNHLVYQREKTYPVGRIYDYPLDDVSELINKSLYYRTEKEITLNAGYEIGNLPLSIKNCILDLVMLDFYNNEADDSKIRRQATHRTMNDLKRFIF